MDKNRVQGVSVGRAGNLPRSPYPSKARSVDPAAAHGRRLSLPQEICPVSLRRLRLSRGNLTAGQKSAEGVLGYVVGEASLVFCIFRSVLSPIPQRVGGVFGCVGPERGR